MNDQARHWDALSAHPPDASVIDPNDTRGFKNAYITQLRNRAIQSALDEANAGRCVLDFGCGTGGLSAALIKTGRTVLGVDISAGLLARTPERRLGPEALFVRYDGNILPFQDGRFDAAVTYVVLNHLMEREVLANSLRELLRVLRPGASLVAIEQVRRRATIDAQTWQHRRTTEGFLAHFREAGFEILGHRIVRYGRLPTTYALRLGWIPVRWFGALGRFEARLGQFVGVLPWDYCDVLFCLRKPVCQAS